MMGGCLCAPRLIRIYSNWRMMRLNAALKPLIVGKGGGGRWDACQIMQTLMRRWPGIHKSYAPTIMPLWSPRLTAGPPIFMCRGAMPKYRFNWHFGPIPLVTKLGCAHRHYRICEMHWRSMTSLLCNRPALHPILLGTDLCQKVTILHWGNVRRLKGRLLPWTRTLGGYWP